MYEKKYHTAELSKFSFLITGGAGFIGSNLVEYLLKNNAGKVRVLDNLTGGFYDNIKDFIANPAFEFIEGDIRNYETCKKAVEGMDYVSHQAALGSVPRSIADPITTNEVNIIGFLNILWAVKEAGSVKRLIYAASSSTYGDNTDSIKVESQIGQPLSPYAITKYVNELYANVFAKTYGIETIGLRYFNVFGPKQSPQGAYAAVVPLFIDALKNDRPAFINGDGEQTRDFTFVENVVQANIKAFFVDDASAINEVYNVACGETTSLNQLLKKINDIIGKNMLGTYRAPRQGDIKNSRADISKAARLLNYEPFIKIDEGLKITIG
ncbi:SDR family oxidoreductase [Mucilaginibacter sp. AW1-3]